MSRIQWGESREYNILMLKIVAQNHEDILKGNTSENLEGLQHMVVDNVNRLTKLLTQIGTLKGVAVVINALIFLALTYLGVRMEMKPTVIIQQPE